MADPLGDYLRWLDGAGVAFEVADDVWRDEDHDGPRIEGDENFRAHEFEGLPPFVEHRDTERGHAADAATTMLARTLLRSALVPRGGRVWDIGCGTGVLAVTAALAGARVVVATDADEDALALARRTASEANAIVQFFAGGGVDAIPQPGTADLVVANLPHEPVPPGASLPVATGGGEDGSAMHGACAEAAAKRLAPGASVCFPLHSLPAPRLLADYTRHFRLKLLKLDQTLHSTGRVRLAGIPLPRANPKRRVVRRQHERRPPVPAHRGVASVSLVVRRHASANGHESNHGLPVLASHA